MRLAAVARSFNDAPCNDGYTGDWAFNAQISLYDDTKRDSETAERRIFSVDPDVILPVRRVIEVHGTRFILGHANLDDFKGSVIRIGYVGHEATHLATIQTLSQLCRDTAGSTAWGGVAWIKNLAYHEQDSELNPFVHLHFSTTETINVAQVVTLGDKKYMVREVFDGPAGTRICYCDVMAEPVVEMATIGTSTYNPTTDASTPVSTPVRVVRMRWQSLYRYYNMKAPSFGPGDIQVALLDSDAPTPVGERIELGDGTWKIASADLIGGDVLLCRGVRYG